MDKRQFAIFKYEHGARTRPTLKQRLIGIALLISAYFAFALPPVGVILGILGLLAFFARPPARLYLGPRYLICGQIIIYYANVTRVDHAETPGTLTLHSEQGVLLTLERDKFPTSARKEEKIRKNKAAKFAKVSARLIEKVRRASPDAAINGAPAAAGSA